MKNSTIALMAVWAGVLLATPANADLITGITLEDWDGTTPNYPNMGPLKAINGEGLQGGTPALSGTHGTTWTQHWYSSLKAGAWITVDLEANYAVDTIHVWNENENNAGRLRGMKNVTIWVSPDEDVANLVKLTTDGTGTQDNGSGDFLFPIGEGLATYTGFDLDLSGVTNDSLLGDVRLIRIQNIDNYGGSNGSGLAEVQFGGGAAPAPSTAFQLVITPNGANYDFRWDSQAGKLYDLVSSTDLSTPILGWTVYDDGVNPIYENILPSGTGTNMLENVVPSGTSLFFAVVEKNPPPLLSEDFEAVTAPGPPADWAFDGNGPGTAWSVGTPAGASTEPDAAANGTQCAGTNIGGNYTASAVASLITKAFTVPTSGATLSFSQYIDTETTPSGDLGSIRLLNAGDNSVLAGGDVATALEGITEEWSSESIPLPAAANGLSVKLEFRFESDADGDVFAGFYIDDVVVTPN